MSHLHLVLFLGTLEVDQFLTDPTMLWIIEDESFRVHQNRELRNNCYKEVSLGTLLNQNNNLSKGVSTTTLFFSQFNHASVAEESLLNLVMFENETPFVPNHSFDARVSTYDCHPQSRFLHLFGQLRLVCLI